MGEAKRRGTFEERRAQAIAEGREKTLIKPRPNGPVKLGTPRAVAAMIAGFLQRKLQGE